MRASHLGPYLAVLPAAYFVDGGTRHAYLVGFGEARGDQRVFHATSSDGLDWSVDSADPFVELGLDLSPPGPVPTSVLPAGDGSWVMFLWGTPAPQFEGGEIWRATAPSPAGPWTADPEPVLTPGPTGAWDDRFVDFPAVVPTTVGHSMLYSAVGFGNPQTTSIGLATSADGVTWERRPEPVIEMGMCGDEPYAAAPRLIALDDGFLVLYDAGRQTVAARSVNLVDWTCVSDGPVLTAADVPGSTGIHTIAATLADERVSLFVESLTGSSGGSELWLAEESGLR